MIIIINAPYGGSVWTHLTLGDVDSGLEGAESAKRDETPWSVYHGPLATARYTWLNRDECSRLGQMHVRFENEKNKTVNLRRRRKRTLRHDTISYHSIVLYILSMCFHRVLVSIDMSVRLRVGLVRYSTAQHSTVHNSQVEVPGTYETWQTMKLFKIQCFVHNILTIRGKKKMNTRKVFKYNICYKEIEANKMKLLK